ncbi:hypothetical protein HZS61_008564 [Fusarium oxysporum f. sp. conglutinans]|uniref:Uncharacterized protein n=2 Tax=Fusarium oxysporum f. sp. conglutinans TaxID=100902 RepID=A0A8H6H2Z7_FUSOX|nr:hypothetical protein HZS61_008564 [Fusarium oxysporum f. sp. conglutinans]
MAVLISPIANNFVELSLLIAAVREGAHSLIGAGLYGGILINVGLVFLSAALIQALRWPQDTSMSWCALLNTPAKTSRNGVPEPLPVLTYIGMAMLPVSLFFDTLLRGATRLLPGHETAFHYTFQALAWLKLLPYLALVAAQFYEQAYPDHLYKLIDNYLPCWIVNNKERASDHSEQGGERNTAISTTNIRVHDEEVCLNQSNNELNPLLGPKKHKGLDVDSCEFLGRVEKQVQGTQFRRQDVPGRPVAVDFVVSYDAGQTAIVWDLMTGDEISRFASYDHLNVAAWMKNGNVAFGDTKESIIVFEPLASGGSDISLTNISLTRP